MPARAERPSWVAMTSVFRRQSAASESAGVLAVGRRPPVQDLIQPGVAPGTMSCGPAKTSRTVSSNSETDRCHVPPGLNRRRSCLELEAALP